MFRFAFSGMVLARFTSENKLRLKFRLHGSNCCHRFNLKAVIVSKLQVYPNPFWSIKDLTKAADGDYCFGFDLKA